MDWKCTSPGAGISRSPGGVLAGVGLALEKREDLRKRVRILGELGVIVIVVVADQRPTLEVRSPCPTVPSGSAKFPR